MVQSGRATGILGTSHLMGTRLEGGRHQQPWLFRERFSTWQAWFMSWEEDLQEESGVLSEAREEWGCGSGEAADLLARCLGGALA